MGQSRESVGAGAPERPPEEAAGLRAAGRELQLGDPTREPLTCSSPDAGL